MIRISLLVSCLFFSTLLFAQGLGNKYSTFAKEIASKNEMTIKDVLCSSEFGVYYYQSKEGERSIILIDLQGELAAEVTIEEKKKEKGQFTVFREAFVVDKSLFVVSSTFIKKQKLNYLIIDKYDSATLVSQGNAVTAEEDYPGKKNCILFGFGALRFNTEDNEIGTAVSPNKQFMAYYTSVYPKRGGEAEGMKISVLDANGNTVWNTERLLKHNSGLIQLLDMKVSDSGYVYVMAKIKSKDSESIKKKVLSFKDSGNEYKELAMPRELTSLEGGEWNLLENGFFEIYGYNKPKGGERRGYEVLVYDPYSKSVVSRVGGTITSNLKLTAITEGAQKNLDKQTKRNPERFKTGLMARQLIKQEDGSSFLIGEHYNIIKTVMVDAKGETSTRLSYYYGDIVVLKIAENGDLVWEAQVPKAQHSNLVSYFSFVATTCNGEVNIVFNDRPENCIPDRKSKKLALYKGPIDPAQIHLFNIDAQGKVSDYSIPREGDASTRFKLRNAIAVPGCGVFIMEESEGKYHGRFVFQEI